MDLDLGGIPLISHQFVVPPSQRQGSELCKMGVLGNFYCFITLSAKCSQILVSVCDR